MFLSIKMTLEVCNDHGDSRSPPAKQAKKVDFEDILRRSHSEDYDHDSASEVLDPSQSNSGTAAMERKPGDRIVNDWYPLYSDSFVIH